MHLSFHCLYPLFARGNKKVTQNESYHEFIFLCHPYAKKDQSDFLWLVFSFPPWFKKKLLPLGLFYFYLCSRFIINIKSLQFLQFVVFPLKESPDLLNRVNYISNLKWIDTTIIWFYIQLSFFLVLFKLLLLFHKLFLYFPQSSRLLPAHYPLHG